MDRSRKHLGCLLPLAVAIACFIPCQSFSIAPLARNRVGSTVQASSVSTTKGSSHQVLEFEEPTTGVTVKLVGCMHYNPASIKVTTDTIKELANENKLGSVVIESCDIRWNQSQTMPVAIQKLLQSEMKSACELAMDTYGRPVVLGDQRINITVTSLKLGFQETMVDLVTPWNGGWGRLLSNVTVAREEAVPLGDSSYLNALAFFDPKLLLAAPVSLIKYPLSYFFKAPLKTTVVLTLLALIDQPPSEAATLATMDQMTVGDWIGPVTVTVVEIALFARVFLKELLAERNEVLARNILDQCKLYQTNKKKSALPFWKAFNSNKKDASEETVYVEGSNKAGPSEQDKVVVAVLGMAHCNGIAKLLKGQKV